MGAGVGKFRDWIVRAASTGGKRGIWRRLCLSSTDLYKSALVCGSGVHGVGGGVCCGNLEAQNLRESNDRAVYGDEVNR